MLKQQLQQKLQIKLSPQQLQLIRLLELPSIELEERIKHELEDNPALEEGSSSAETFDSDAEENINENSNPSENADTDLSLGDYLNEDDIPDYKLREMDERAEQKEAERLNAPSVIDKLHASIAKLKKKFATKKISGREKTR